MAPKRIALSTPDRVGPSNPVRAGRTQGPGSVRRSIVLTTRRVDVDSGVRGIVGVGVDHSTLRSDRPETLLTVRVEGHVAADGTVLELATTAEDVDCTPLIGMAVNRGFRSQSAALTFGSRGAGLTRSIFDDIPIVCMFSGYTYIRDGVLASHGNDHTRSPLGVCAGWAHGGVPGREAVRGVHLVTLGPAADPPEPADPALADLVPTIPVTGIRRRRTLEVAPGDPIRVRAWMRDSYGEPGGDETVMHEYDLDAEVEASTGLVANACATARVLPYRECPLAVNSVGRLLGRSVASLRDSVRSDFVGESTCSHLNDMCRGLQDIDALAFDGP